MNIVLKKRTTDDADFIFQLFSEYKTEELCADNWPEEMKQQIISMQFNAHEQHYRTNLPDASDSIVFFKNEKAGRIIVHETPESFHIADIILLKEYRNKGIGRTLLERVIKKARQEGKTTRLKVNKGNRAIGLYKKIGGEIIRESATNYVMEFNDGQ